MVSFPWSVVIFKLLDRTGVVSRGATLAFWNRRCGMQKVLSRTFTGIHAGHIAPLYFPELPLLSPNLNTPRSSDYAATGHGSVSRSLRDVNRRTSMQRITANYKTFAVSWIIHNRFCSFNRALSDINSHRQLIKNLNSFLLQKGT